MKEKRIMAECEIILVDGSIRYTVLVEYCREFGELVIDELTLQRVEHDIYETTATDDGKPLPIMFEVASAAQEAALEKLLMADHESEILEACARHEASGAAQKFGGGP